MVDLSAADALLNLGFNLEKFNAILYADDFCVLLFFPPPTCFRRCFLCFIRRFWNQVLTWTKHLLEAGGIFPLKNRSSVEAGGIFPLKNRSCTYLRFGQIQRRRQLHSLRSGEVPLRLEPCKKGKIL